MGVNSVKEMNKTAIYNLGQVTQREKPIHEQIKNRTTPASFLDDFPQNHFKHFKNVALKDYTFHDVNQIGRDVYDMFNDSILSDLLQQGITVTRIEALNAKQRKFVDDYFHQPIFPLLTPLAVDASWPFPRLMNKELNFVVLVERKLKSQPLFSILKIPSVFSRCIELPTNGSRGSFVLLDQLISKYIDTLYTGYNVCSFSHFRLLKNTGDVQGKLRVEVEHSLHCILEQFLIDSLDLQPTDISFMDGPLDLCFLKERFSLLN